MPLRYGRMLQSPFTFYRGSAGVMAADLAATPATGIHVQACGDAHLMNFGGFATPERRLIFDINDLDETLARTVGVGRQTARRLVRAGRPRQRAVATHDGRDAAIACARSYRRKMRDFADMDVLDIWYARLDDSDFLAMLPKERKAVLRKRIAKATARSSSELVFPKLAEQAGGQPRIHDTPPTIFHAEASRGAGYMRHDAGRPWPSTGRPWPRTGAFCSTATAWWTWRSRWSASAASGRLCMVALMMSVADHPFFLQFKEANASVLEAYAGKSAYAHHGERVVQGQRLMQPASDLFLGWATGPKGRHFYLRQLRDVKLIAAGRDLRRRDAVDLRQGLRLGLARAHAKAGDPWTISGYLGKAG